jgi:hypothetical protein
MRPRPRWGQGWRKGVIITMKTGFLQSRKRKPGPDFYGTFFYRDCDRSENFLIAIRFSYENRGSIVPEKSGSG